MNQKYIPLIIVITLIIGGLLAFNSTTINETSNQNDNAANTESGDSFSLESETGGIYASYIGNELKSDKTNVIFFAAGWCPTCQTLDKNIIDNVNNLPEDINILRADYDNESELREKYDVRFQHTLVQVDGEGNEVKKWSGGFDIEDVLEQVI